MNEQLELDFPGVVVRVTQEHIDKGCRSHKLHCPVALALGGAGYPEPAATSMNAYWGRRRIYKGVPLRGDNLYEAPLPPEAISFIANFDRGVPKEPFEFILPHKVSVHRYN